MKITGWLMFVVALLMSSHGAAQVRLTLSPLVSVQVNDAGEATLPLSAVAAVNAPKALRAPLAAMPVQLAPASLASGALSREILSAQVQAWLKRAAPAETLTVVGPAAVKLKQFHQRVPAQQIVAAARGALDRQLQQRYESFSMKVVSRLDDVRLEHPGEWTLAVAEDVPLSSRTVLKVSVMQQGRACATVPVWFAVKAPKEVWVLQQSAEEGAAVAEVPMMRASVDMFSLNSEPLQNEQEWQGKVFAVPVVDGQVITRAMLREAPLVNAGETVKVNVVQGRVRIQSMAEALQPGRKGQTIRLRSMSSQEEFTGSVMAGGEILVGQRPVNPGESK